MDPQPPPSSSSVVLVLHFGSDDRFRLADTDQGDRMGTLEAEGEGHMYTNSEDTFCGLSTLQTLYCCHATCRFTTAKQSYHMYLRFI